MCRANVRTKNTVSAHPGCVGLMFRTKNTFSTHTGCVGLMLGIKILSQYTLGVGLMFVLGGGYIKYPGGTCLQNRLDC